ncbi:hypothetical protein ACLKA7_014112 [Drosophila subpalustris]
MAFFGRVLLLLVSVLTSVSGYLNIFISHHEVMKLMGKVRQDKFIALQQEKQTEHVSEEGEEGVGEEAKAIQLPLEHGVARVPFRPPLPYSLVLYGYLFMWKTRDGCMTQLQSPTPP